MKGPNPRESYPEVLTLNAKVNPQVVWLVAAQIVSMTKLRKAFMTVGMMAVGVVLMHIEMRQTRQAKAHKGPQIDESQ